MQPLPNATKAYGMLRQEEKKRETTTPKYMTPAILSTYTNANQHSQPSYRQNMPSSGNGIYRNNTSNRRSYGNCQKEGHYKNECYQLVGYPIGPPLHGKVKPVNKETDSRTSVVNMDAGTYGASTSGKDLNDDAIVFAKMDNLQNQLNQVMMMLQNSQGVCDPKILAAGRSNAKEINAFEANNTWEITTLPLSKKPIGYKWVFRIKYNASETVERYKARVVAKGFNQKESIDHIETFTPMAKMVTVKTILVLASTSNWHIHQLDINNAFLHGDLHEEVYIAMPTGYNKPHPPNVVCRLKKSLYGLKQANRQWFIKLTNFLISIGFEQSNSLSFINEIKDKLHKEFSIKDLGPLNYYLGIGPLKGIIMTQRKYALDLIEQAGLRNTKHAKNPFDPNAKLTYEDGDLLPDPSIDKAQVGKLIYFTINRPDVAFAAQVMSQLSHSPHISHMEALKRVIT
ncbi:retrovirus-related pol polyprotein from transposon RE1, partial [Tanacetum coccineum]